MHNGVVWKWGCHWYSRHRMLTLLFFCLCLQLRAFVPWNRRKPTGSTGRWTLAFWMWDVLFFLFIWSFDWIWSAVLYESCRFNGIKGWPDGRQAKMLNKRREFNCREVVTSIPVWLLLLLLLTGAFLFSERGNRGKILLWKWTFPPSNKTRSVGPEANRGQSGRRVTDLTTHWCSTGRNGNFLPKLALIENWP